MFVYFVNHCIVFLIFKGRSCLFDFKFLILFVLRLMVKSLAVPLRRTFWYLYPVTDSRGWGGGRHLPPLIKITHTKFQHPLSDKTMNVVSHCQCRGHKAFYFQSSLHITKYFYGNLTINVKTLISFLFLFLTLLQQTDIGKPGTSSHLVNLPVSIMI